MASIKEWYQFIIDEKQTLSSLDSLEPNPETTEAFVNDLKTTSKVAIWRLTAWVMAFLAFTLEQLWATKEAELQAIQDATPPHTKRWWNEQIAAFQYGDNTIVDSNGKVTYEVIDEDKQIVKRNNVYVEVVGSNAARLVITAGKYDSSTFKYVQLSSAEFSAFSSYINEISPLGVKKVLFNQDGGFIDLGGYIWYDSDILNSNLTRVDDPTVSAFANGMNKYIENYVIPNSRLNQNEMIKYLLAEEGINDIDLTTHDWYDNPLALPVAVDQGSPTFKKELDIDNYVGYFEESLTKVGQ